MNTETSFQGYDTIPLLDPHNCKTDLQTRDRICLRRVAADKIGIKILRNGRYLRWMDQETKETMIEIGIDFSVIKPKLTGFDEQALITATILLKDPSLALVRAPASTADARYYDVCRRTTRAGAPSKSTASGRHNSS